MKRDVLMRVVDRRLRYKVLLEERIRQMEAEIDRASDSITYVRIAGEVEDLWHRGRHNWKHIGGCFAGRWETCRPRRCWTTRPISPRGGTRADHERW